MSTESPSSPSKDLNRAHPIPLEWRRLLRDIVKRLAAGDFALSDLPFVSSVSRRTQEQIKAYLAQYREALIDLPEATWSSSVAQWTETHWEVLVDLWTKESGNSDLCLSVRVFEVAGGGYRMEVDSVHVP